MAKTDFTSVDHYITSVDHYIAAQPESVRGILERVRRSIRKAVPGAEEVISYIPAYKLHGADVAGWKQHYSLYPANQRVVAAFKDELAPYEISKGTIRFPLSKPVPVKLIERIANSARKKWPSSSRQSHPVVLRVNEVLEVLCDLLPLRTLSQD